MNFVRADAILRVSNHPNCAEPFVERQWTVFKDRSDFHRELFFRRAVFAFPNASSGNESPVFGRATRALHAGRPTELNHEF